MKKLIKNYIERKMTDLKYASALSVAAAMTNNETFKDIKNCNCGKSVVLCGAGPSLKKYIPIEGAVHVALNRALLNDKVKYDWFIADDWDGIDFMQQELIEYNCTKFFGHQIGQYDRQIPESFRIKCNARRYYTDCFIVNGFKSRFVCDIDKMPVGNITNIALSAMQIVLFSNPSKVYIVGCDATADGHFIENSNISEEQRNRQIKDMEMAVAGDNVISLWYQLKKFARVFYPDTEIISINPVGLKGIFKDEYK